MSSVAKWTPLDLPGLELWLDFDDISTLYQDDLMAVPVTSDLDVIGAVADKSENGAVATQATSSKRPLYRSSFQNGRGVCQTDGVDDYFSLTSELSITTKNYLFFMAYRPITGRYIFDTSAGRLILAHQQTLASGLVAAFDGTWHGVAANTTAWQTMFFLFDSSATTTTIFRNGASIGSAAYAPKNIGNFISLFTHYTGNTSERLGCEMMDFGFTSVVTSTGDRTLLQNYLKNKAGTP